MKRYLTFTLLLVYKLAQSQPTIEELVNLIPDKPEKDNIFLIVIPEWEHVQETPKISYGRLRGNIPYYTIVDNPASSQVIFGNQSFNTNSFQFSEAVNPKEPLSIGFLPTNEPGQSVMVNLPINGLKEISIERVRGYQKTTLTQAELLSKMDKPKYKIDDARYYLTQDRAHVLLDLKMHYEALEGRINQHRFVTLKINDFSIVHDAELTQKDWNSYFVPYGYYDKEFHWPMQSRNSKTGFTYTAPGTHFFLGKYQYALFWNGRKAVGKFDMTTGKFSFVKPPREDMLLTTRDFVNTRDPNEADKYTDPMWLTEEPTYAKDIKNHEFLFHYHEKDSTMTTISQYSITNETQVVMKKGDENVERLGNRKNSILITRIRIRDIHTQELISEYCVLLGSPAKVSHDGKYIAFTEGTSHNNYVVSLRNRKTGELIDRCTAISPGNYYTTNIVETSNGFLVYENNRGKFSCSLLAFEGKPTIEATLQNQQNESTATNVATANEENIHRIEKNLNPGEGKIFTDMNGIWVKSIPPAQNGDIFKIDNIQKNTISGDFKSLLGNKIGYEAKLKCIHADETGYIFYLEFYNRPSWISEEKYLHVIKEEKKGKLTYKTALLNGFIDKSFKKQKLLYNKYVLTTDLRKKGYNSGWWFWSIY